MESKVTDLKPKNSKKI